MSTTDGSYDMLGQLGVVVPSSRVIPPAPSAAASTREPRVMKPSARAPQPAASATASASASHRRRHGPAGTSTSHSLSPARAADVPSVCRSGQHRRHTVAEEEGETVLRMEGGRGGDDEFLVYDATVPCNLAVNAGLSGAAAERARLEARRDAARVDRARADDAAFAVEKRRAAAEGRQARAAEVRSARAVQEGHAARASSAGAAALRREREQAVEAYARAVDDQVRKVAAAKAAKASYRGDLATLLERKREKEDAEARHKLKPDINGFEIGTHADRPREEVVKEGAALRKVWDQQLQAKHEAERQRRLVETRLQQQPQAHAPAVREGEKEERRAKAAGLLEAQLEQLEDKQARETGRKAAETAVDMRRVVRDRAAKVEVEAREAAESSARKDAFRTLLARQLADRSAAATGRAEREEAAAARRPANHNGLTAQKGRKVLLRCPATNRLLPPSAFNIVMKPEKRVVVP